MLALKFMIQGRTGQPAHSFWLLKADGSRLNGGLAMQDRLKDQGVHRGTVLHITCDNEDAPLSVNGQVRDERPRDHWLDALNQTHAHGHSRGHSHEHGKAAREWAGSRGHRDMAKEWGAAGMDGWGCTRACILMHRHKVGL
jgi:hypothetical protein